MEGYNIPLIRKISEVVKIPVIALGGAGNIQHMKQAYFEAFANGLAAGSMFVYHGARKAVLINYPERKELINSFI
jgi:cyclase